MIKVALNAARSRAALSVPPGRVEEMSADDVEALIWQLAGAREAMLPPRSGRDPTAGTRVAGGVDMRWYVEPGPEAGSVQLLLFQPGMGWVGIMLDKPGVATLSAAIESAQRGAE